MTAAHLKDAAMLSGSDAAVVKVCVLVQVQIGARRNAAHQQYRQQGDNRGQTGAPHAAEKSRPHRRLSDGDVAVAMGDGDETLGPEDSAAVELAPVNDVSEMRRCAYPPLPFPTKPTHPQAHFARCSPDSQPPLDAAPHKAQHAPQTIAVLALFDSRCVFTVHRTLPVLLSVWRRALAGEKWRVEAGGSG